MHEGGGRQVINRAGNAELFNASAIEHDDGIGNLDCLLLIVRDEYAGEVQFVVQAAQPAPQLVPDLTVQGTEGFIEQQHVGIHRERPSQGNALPLSAGELRGKAIAGLAQLHQLEQRLHLAANVRGRRPFAARLDLESEGDVFEHRHVTEQRVMLKHESDLAVPDRPQSRILAIEQHLSRIGDFETRDDAQQRGLAAARGPEQRDQRAGGDVEIDVFNRGEFTELLRHAAQCNAHGLTLLVRSRAWRTACRSSGWRRSSKLLPAKVSSASNASSEATANAAA